MTRESMRGAAATCVLALAIAAAVTGAWAKQAVVTTKDGKTFEGDVTEKGDAIIIIAKGGTKITLNRANVESIEAAASAEEQFRQRMAKLGKKDSAGHVELARWAVDRKEYDLALEALDAAVVIDPNNEEALKMRRTVQNQRRLARQAAAGKGGPAPAEEPTDAPTDEQMPDEKADAPTDAPTEDGQRRGRGEGDRTRQKGKKHRLVTDDEINRIRQLELQKGERVQIRFQNDVRRRYQASSEFTPQEFAQMTPQDAGFEILDNGSSQMRKDVLVATDPASLAQFKSAVQRNVLPGCASNSCHGGGNPKAGDFTLHNPANKDAETYTNFLLMQQYKGSADGKEYAMIDRARPENSLLMLFGLPQGSSPLPHPKAQNFRPIFKGKSDPKYKAVVDWATRTLAPVAPDYNIDLTKPPEDDATTRPTRGSRRAAPANE